MRAVIAGMAIGLVIGMVTDNFAIGITLGIVFALVLRSVALWLRGRQDAEEGPAE